MFFGIWGADILSCHSGYKHVLSEIFCNLRTVVSVNSFRDKEKYPQPCEEFLIGIKLPQVICYVGECTQELQIFPTSSTSLQIVSHRGWPQRHELWYPGRPTGVWFGLTSRLCVSWPNICMTTLHPQSSNMAIMLPLVLYVQPYWPLRVWSH